MTPLWYVVLYLLVNCWSLLCTSPLCTTVTSRQMHSFIRRLWHRTCLIFQNCLKNHLTTFFHDNFNSKHAIGIIIGTVITLTIDHRKLVWPYTLATQHSNGSFTGHRYISLPSTHTFFGRWLATGKYPFAQKFFINNTSKHCSPAKNNDYLQCHSSCKPNALIGNDKSLNDNLSLIHISEPTRPY